MRINDDSEITEIAIGDEADEEGILYTISIWAKNIVLIDIINRPRCGLKAYCPSERSALQKEKGMGKIGIEE